jgi:hypothetical protein
MLSYTERRSRPIPWESLMVQFGSGFSTADMRQAVSDFRKAFSPALKIVFVVYPQAKIERNERGLVPMPSRPDLLPAPQGQRALFECAEELPPCTG